MRPQNIFLVLSSTLMGLTFLFPFGYTATAAAEGIFADAQLTQSDNIALMILCIAAAALSFVGLFFYSIKYDAGKYRMQRLMAQVGMIAAFGTLGLAAYFLFLSGVAAPSVGISLFLPALAVIFGYMAIRQINQDESVIRSANRIR